MGSGGVGWLGVGMELGGWGRDGGRAWVGGRVSGCRKPTPHSSCTTVTLFATHAQPPRHPPHARPNPHALHLMHSPCRTTRVPKLPRDLFMIMRVITLLRGVLASMEVHDLSSALLWQPLAEKVSGRAWQTTRQHSVDDKATFRRGYYAKHLICKLWMLQTRNI